MDVPITKQELKAIDDICFYLHRDEQRHWQESGKPKKGHVFNAIQRLTKLRKLYRKLYAA